MKKNRESISFLGNLIRKERKARGLTQQKLGDFSGTGINFVSQLERGKITVRMDKVLDVLKTLGLQLKVEYGKDEIV